MFGAVFTVLSCVYCLELWCFNVVSCVYCLELCLLFRAMY